MPSTTAPPPHPIARSWNYYVYFRITRALLLSEFSEHYIPQRHYVGRGTFDFTFDMRLCFVFSNSPSPSHRRNQARGDCCVSCWVVVISCFAFEGTPTVYLSLYIYIYMYVSSLLTAPRAPSYIRCGITYVVAHYTALWFVYNVFSAMRFFFGIIIPAITRRALSIWAASSRAKQQVPRQFGWTRELHMGRVYSTCSMMKMKCGGQWCPPSAQRTLRICMMCVCVCFLQVARNISSIRS